MKDYYSSVYTTLRGALVDRERDDVVNSDNEVIVPVPTSSQPVHYALKPLTPSNAYLLAYMTLYYPGWLTQQSLTKPTPLFYSALLGGHRNSGYPFFYDDKIGEIAIAVGIANQLYNAAPHPITDEMVLIPNYNNPIVRHAKAIQELEQVDYTHSKDILIDLLQTDELSAEWTNLADDFIGNTSFIQEAFFESKPIEGDVDNGQETS